MNSFAIAGGVVAAVFYIPLCVAIVTGGVKQNFATWLLWALLDGIVTASVIAQKGNFFLPLAYVLGNVTTTFLIFRSGAARWTRFETVVALMAAVCMGVWFTSGAKVATIAGTAAVTIAGVPQLIDAYKKPWENPLLIYCGFLAANILSTAGGKDWSIEERFYPAATTVLCLVIVLFTARKLWVTPPSAKASV